MTYDVSVADYQRIEGEFSDNGRIMRAVNDCERGVLYFPKGVYEISQMLEITNCCSILMHKSAVLKAVAPMEYVVKYDAAASYPDVEECDGHLVPSDDYDAEDWNLFFVGGYVDGAGLASCMCLNSFKHFTMRDVSFRNGKKYGLRIEEKGSTWTYELVAQNLYLKCTMPGLMKPIEYENTILVDCDLQKSMPMWKLSNTVKNKSNRVIEFRLEGDYTGYNDRLLTSDGKILQNRTVINFDTANNSNKLESRTFEPITNLQLLQLNTGVSYPFADRLIEYLFDQSISPLNDYPENFKYITNLFL